VDPPAHKQKPRVKEPVSRVEKTKQRSAQQEQKQTESRGLCPQESRQDWGTWELLVASVNRRSLLESESALCPQHMGP
uniref:Uncharacterized protein n=1 Tax=Bos taurus TaxID=9913 RepID=A0A3Q1LQD2_BOVIN